MSRVKRIVKAIYNKKVRFINYRKIFNGQFPISWWSIEFNRWWMGDIWQWDFRGYAISIDMRDDWLKDMVSPKDR